MKGSADEKEPLVRRKTWTEVKIPSWEFPGWGKQFDIAVPQEELINIEHSLNKPDHRLSEWPATAISGNDILSSCFYVTGTVVSRGGILAPINLGLVAGVLYLFRFIYGEAISALPMNGGSYNVLINTTSKATASFAASLAILSYISTAVVSATSASNYLANIIPGFPIVIFTCLILFAFAFLNFMGIEESSKVALIIFIGHVITLIVLSVSGIVYACQNPDIFYENMKHEWPSINVSGSFMDGSVFMSLFFGTAAAMLGCSGFESSSQFVQEQAEGVFPKTLRNMWISIAIFNPLLAALAICTLPFEGPQGVFVHSDDVLAEIGLAAGGTWLNKWVAIDAFVVLCGGVLTAFVGVTGLIRRMASDRCLPEFLLQTNKWRGTNHYIIFGFFFVAASLEVALNGDTATLSGVFTFSFLSLMCLFSLGTMMLKFKRPDLPRDTRASWAKVMLGFLGVFACLLGNLIGDPKILSVFTSYWVGVLIIVAIMFQRTNILRLILFALRQTFPSRHRDAMEDVEGLELADGGTSGGHTGARGGRTIARLYREVRYPAMLFFAKTDDLVRLNKAVLYVRSNEQTSHLYIVHVYKPGTTVPPSFTEAVHLLDKMYPKIQIDFVKVEGTFGRAMIEWISANYSIPKNLMFIKSPDAHTQVKIASLGGVRVIVGS